MKIRILLCSVSFLLGYGAIAQTDVGAKLGLNYNTWTVPDEDNVSGIGLHLGVYLNIGISDNIYFRPELLYSDRGVKETIDETFSYNDPFLGQVTEREEGSFRLSLGYLEAPMLLGFKVNDNFHLHVGPVLGLRMGYKSSFDYTERVTVNGNTTTTTVEGSSKDDEGVSSFDFGAAIGLAYELDGGLNFGLRFTRGFTTIYSDAIDPIVHNVFQFSVGYTFVKN
jgi:hypothetical protein